MAYKEAMEREATLSVPVIDWIALKAVSVERDGENTLVRYWENKELKTELYSTTMENHEALCRNFADVVFQHHGYRPVKVADLKGKKS